MKRNIRLVAGGASALLVAAFALSACSSTTSSGTSPAAGDSSTSAPEETSAPAAEETTAPEPAAPAEPAGTTFDDGSWIVGEDFPAGTYTLAEPPTDSCYWAVLKAGTNGEDIIANENVSGGYPTVTLKKGQEFESERCGTWTTQPGALKASTFGEGDWLVGRDIVAGRYRVTSPVTDSCYWAILKGGTNGEDIIANDNVDGGRPTITVKNGQVVQVTRCGEWAKV